MVKSGSVDRNQRTIVYEWIWRAGGDETGTAVLFWHLSVLTGSAIAQNVGAPVASHCANGRFEPEAQMSVVEEEASPAIPSHPEEIKSVFDLRLGKHVTLQGSARITPAGVISAGIAVAVMMLATGYLASSTRRRRQ
ncbi:hypothetical protein ACFSQT_13510 [Mesorhizobium calcicola]|uniref:Uncharacterized protein n=1 Tax=Mesorhizobium calcicola TaxID=1300310 RepID=A0ABW4WDZ3_9HYPH